MSEGMKDDAALAGDRYPGSPSGGAQAAGTEAGGTDVLTVKGCEVQAVTDPLRSRLRRQCFSSFQVSLCLKRDSLASQ